VTNGNEDRPAPRLAPSYWHASLRIFELSLGEMLWSRRTIFMALVVGSPVLLAIIIRAIDVVGVVGLRVESLRINGATIFGMLIWVLYLRFIVPVLGIFYGTALMADEIEDKTITYLFTRPIPRGAVLIGKYLAYLTCTSLVVLPSVMLVYFLLVPIGSASLVSSFPSLVTDLGLLALGLAVYGSLFGFVGARLKRPVVFGLIFAFGWEQAALIFPGYLRRATVAYYLQALVPHAMPEQSTLGAVQALFRDAPSGLVSMAWLALFWLGFLFLAARTVERREYVLEQ
jgi:ABC-type transport system involved in multi-copper enzyme maturation permease subunit